LCYPLTAEALVGDERRRGSLAGSVDKTSKYMREEVDRLGNLIKSANIKLE